MELMAAYDRLNECDVGFAALRFPLLTFRYRTGTEKELYRYIQAVDGQIFRAATVQDLPF